MVARLRGRPTPRPPGSEKETTEEHNQPQEKAKNTASSKLLILITSLSLLSAVGTTSALLYFTIGPGNKPAEVHEEAPQTSTGPIMDLGPFIVNLGDINQRRYLRVAISLDFQTSDPHFVGNEANKGGGGHGGESKSGNSELKNSLKKLEPIFQDVTITTLSAKSPEELGSPTGKEMLKSELIAKINRHMPTQTAVQNIYFTNFVIQ